MIHTKKLTMILSITLFALIIALLILMQKSAQADEQAKIATLEQEYKQPEIAGIILFNGFDSAGKMLLNENYKFKRGTTVYVMVSMSQISNPTTEQGKIVFGLKEYAQLVNADQQQDTPFNGLVVDMDNYLQKKGDPVVINNQFEIPNDITPGTHYLTITIFDKISKKETTSEPIKFAII